MTWVESHVQGGFIVLFALVETDICRFVDINKALVRWTETVNSNNTNIICYFTHHNPLYLFILRSFLPSHLLLTLLIDHLYIFTS